MTMTRVRCCVQNNYASEEGFVLIAVVFFVAILMISLAVALPRVRQEIQRDREIETMHRGKEYAQAIRLYYRKFGAYPTSIDALVMTNNIRFLRKRYADPITGKDDWKPILLGQNKAPTAMGFFGEPLDGVGATANAGLSGGTPTSSGSANSSTNETTSATDSDSNSTPGGPIIGFSPASPNQSILNYKTKSHYDEWEFVYDPRVDRLGRGLQPAPPTAPNPPYSGSPGFGPAPSGGNSGANNPSSLSSPQ
jgi:type II secretory pathway pseudopilin PulG